MDVQRRFKEHVSQGKKCAKFLRGKGPLELVYTEAMVDKSTAYKKEMWIKKLSKGKKEEIINGIK